jgi:hypothetical protein
VSIQTDPTSETFRGHQKVEQPHKERRRNEHGRSKHEHGEDIVVLADEHMEDDADVFDADPGLEISDGDGDDEASASARASRASADPVYGSYFSGYWDRGEFHYF